MSIPRCTEVCDHIVGWLNMLGFEISDDEDHSDVLDALSECVLIPTNFVVLDGARYLLNKAQAKLQTQMEERITGLIFDEAVGSISEDDCAELGRRIFRILAKTLRPDFFETFELV